MLEKSLKPEASFLNNSSCKNYDISSGGDTHTTCVVSDDDLDSHASDDVKSVIQPLVCQDPQKLSSPSAESLNQVTRTPSSPLPRTSRIFSAFADDSEDWDSGLEGELDLSALRLMAVPETAPCDENTGFTAAMKREHSRKRSFGHMRARETSSTNSSLGLMQIMLEDLQPSLSQEISAGKASPIPNMMFPLASSPVSVSLLSPRRGSREASNHNLFGSGNKDSNALTAWFNTVDMRWEGFDEPDMSGFSSGSDAVNSPTFSVRRVSNEFRKLSLVTTNEEDGGVGFESDDWDEFFESKDIMPSALILTDQSLYVLKDASSWRSLRTNSSKSLSESGSFRTLKKEDVKFEVPSDVRYNVKEARWEHSDGSEFPVNLGGFDLDDGKKSRSSSNLLMRSQSARGSDHVEDETIENPDPVNGTAKKLLRGAFALDGATIRHFLACETQHDKAMNSLLTVPVYSRLKREANQNLLEQTDLAGLGSASYRRRSDYSQPTYSKMHRLKEPIPGSPCESINDEDLQLWNPTQSSFISNLGSDIRTPSVSPEKLIRGRSPERILHPSLSPSKHKTHFLSLTKSPVHALKNRSKTPPKLKSHNPAVSKIKRTIANFSQYQEYLRATQRRPNSSNSSYQNSPTRNGSPTLPISPTFRRLRQSTNSSSSDTRDSISPTTNVINRQTRRLVRTASESMNTRHFDKQDLKLGAWIAGEMEKDKQRLKEQVDRLRENQVLALQRVAQVHELIASMKDWGSFDDEMEENEIGYP